MKISNNKNVPFLNKKTQNSNQFVPVLSPRVQKTTPQNFTKNIQNLPQPTNYFFNHGSEKNAKAFQYHVDVNNQKVINNQQSPKKFQLIENNAFLKNNETIVDKKRNQLLNNKKIATNFQNQYNTIPYQKEADNLYAVKNIFQNPNSLKIQFPQQSQKNIYITKSDRNDNHDQLLINQMMINNTNNFITKIPQNQNIYTQQKNYQSNPIQIQKNSKQYLKTLNSRDQVLLQKSKSSHNLIVPNIHNLQKSQSNQSQRSQEFQNRSKLKQGKLNLKKKKNNQNQGLKVFQQSNPSHEYYNQQDNAFLSPYMSQKEKKKHNFLRLSKSLEHHQTHKQKLHLHTSKFGNKIEFDRMYDEEDFGSKNDGRSEQSIGMDYESLGGSEKQRKMLTSMQSELKRKKRKQNVVISNPQIQLKQYGNNSNFNIQQNSPKSLQIQPIFKAKSNENINIHKKNVHQDEYMIQMGNIVPNPQIPFNLNQIVTNPINQQIYKNQVFISPQNIQRNNPNLNLNFQVKYQTKPIQQVKVLHSPQNVVISQPNKISYYQHQSLQKNQSNIRPNSSMPKFGGVKNQQQVKNQKNIQNQGVSKMVLDLNSNIQKQKKLIAQPSIVQRPQSQTVQGENNKVIGSEIQNDRIVMKLRHSPSFGANNGPHNSFLNLNSHLKSKKSLQKHLQQDHLLPQKKQSTNSLSSILNNQIGLRAAQVQNNQTVDNLSQFHIKKDYTKKTLLSKASSHGLSDLIMGIKPITVTNNSLKAQQNIDVAESGKSIQRTSSHGLSDLIMGIKPIQFNTRNPQDQQKNQQIINTGQNPNRFLNRANSNQSLDSQRGLNQFGQFNECLPLDSKPSSPQLAFGKMTVAVQKGSTVKNKVSPQNSLPDDYLDINSNITTLQKLTYNQPQNQQKSKIDKKPSFSSLGSFSNLRLNSNSKIINNFNYNSQQSGSKLKSISQMQSQWQKQSSFQQKSQTNFAQFQQPYHQNLTQSFQKNMNNQKIGNFQSIRMGSSNNFKKINSINENTTSLNLNQIQSGISQDTGLFNVPSGFLKQSIEKKLSQNQQILPKQQSGFGQQFLKLNTKIIQSKGIPNTQQVLNSGKPMQQISAPQQWLNINREKYSTSEYLNAEQMKKRLENVEGKQKNIYQKNQPKDINFNEQNKEKNKQLSKLKVIQKQNDDFRQKINSISETLLSMTPIAISQDGLSSNRHSPHQNIKPFNIDSNQHQKINKVSLQKENAKKSNELFKGQNQGQQRFQKTAEYFSHHDKNNSFDQHIQYQYSQDGSYGNFNKQSKKSSFLLHQNSDYSQNQDLSDTKKITYTYGQTAKKKSHSKMKSRKSSKLSSSISQSSLNSIDSQHKKQANLYTKRQNKTNNEDKKDSKIKSNINSTSQIKNKNKTPNIMYSNSVFSSQQQNYHTLPKPSIYETDLNQFQLPNQKDFQQSFKNDLGYENKITYTPVQSQQMLKLSSVNSLSFNFVATNNQPSRNSLKQNSMIGSIKNMDSSKLLEKQLDKMQGSKSKVQKYLINQKLNQQPNLYKPIPSNKIKSKDSKTYSVIHEKEFSMQPVQYGEDMDRSEYSPKKKRLQTSQYGISQDSVNYVKIDRGNSPSLIRHSTRKLDKKQQIQNYLDNQDANQSQISAILNQNYQSESKYYESRYEIHPSSRQVRYVQSPYLNDDSIYGKDSKVIQTIQFNPVLYQGNR